MSYLIGPRLIFAGRFRADVSTVNNDPINFGTERPDGQWNPKGTGTWRLLDCRVTSGRSGDGAMLTTAADDPVIGFILADANARAPAKIVDLDPEQQMVSAIWGLQVRLIGPDSVPVFAGEFAVTAFADIWPRAKRGGGDMTLAAYWQSVLTDVSWGETLGSRLLEELRESSPDAFSIKFNVDGFSMNPASAAFATGRLVGVIGAAAQGEPRRCVAGRLLMPIGDASSVNFFAAAVDKSRGKLVADLGNALPTSSSGGPVDAGTLELGYRKASKFTSLGAVGPTEDGWYERTGGIVEAPADRPLTSDELQRLETALVALASTSADGELSLVASEGVDGLVVQAEPNVLRLAPGDSASVTLVATRFGAPAAHLTLALGFDSSGLQGGPGNLTVGVPTSALSFPHSVATGADGRAIVVLSASAPGNPRGYIDGQVYGVRCTIPGAANGAGAYFNPAEFISVLVWDAYTPPDEPTWWNDVEPILAQYAKLYPVMRPIVDLSEYNSVIANNYNLIQVFGLSPDDPNYMPVTRDLAPAKREMILKWIGKPGGPPPALGGPPPAKPVPTQTASLPDDNGGKTAAMRRIRGRGPILLIRSNEGESA